ncbi:MAG: PAS domain S-box protein, partial [Ignavibacteriales bacterium]|nr:PAS domain S-box protein [Ignavibacteriales bacterium]
KGRPGLQGASRDESAPAVVRWFQDFPQPQAVINRRGEVIAANKSARAILRIKPSEVPALSIEKVLKNVKPKAIVRKLSRNGVMDIQSGIARRGDLSIQITSRKLGPDSYLLLLRESDQILSRDRGHNFYRSSSFFSQFIAADSVDGEGYYQTIVQHSPYGVAIVFKETVVMANPMFAKILGHRASQEIEGRKILDVVEPGATKFFDLLARRKLKGESIPARFETQMLQANGSLIDVEASFTLGSFKGELALNLTISDITLRKELERRLTDSEQLFRNVVNSMVDALVITDLQGRVLDVNDEFERLTGFDRREAINALIPYPWVDEEDLRHYMVWLDGLRVKSELRDFDITWVNKKGKRIAVSLNTTLLHNSAGEPMLMVNIARDITERQAAREELRRQLQRLEVLYELGKTLGGTLDPKEIARNTFLQLKRVIVSDAFYIDLFDESTQEIHQLHAVDIINGRQKEVPSPASASPLHPGMAAWKVIRSRKTILELRSEVPRKPQAIPFGDVHRASASLMYAPMFSKDRIIGILSAQSYTVNAYSRDQLTLLESIANLAAIAIEKANLHQEILEKSRQIEARNKELDDFTYVVSHDLKEPLISVEGYAKILKQEYSDSFDPAGTEYMKSILDSCGHMKRLIEDLLQLSRVSKLAEERTRINLGPLIRQVVEELQFTIRERKAEVTIGKDLPSVTGVEQHLKIVFRNLISNAIKFCDKEIPRIDITATVKGNRAEVDVSDNGIGIEREFHEKIFMIFQRLYKKEEFEGTGAGLTIVKKIVEAYGGSIWVTSVPNEGTTFHFILPLQ